MFQRGAQALQKLGTGNGAQGIPDMPAEVVGEGAVESAADPCVRRGLVVPAARKEHMVRGVPRLENPGDRQIFFPHLTAQDIDRRHDESGFIPLFGGQQRQRGGLAGPGSGMAGVYEHLQANTGRQSRKDLFQIVIDDIGPLPVHIVGADDFIEPVLQFIAVPVPDLGAMTRKMEEETVTGLRVFHQPVEPG